jgi:hypothetical protein
MKSHPRETSLVLAEAAASGKTVPPPQITDPWWAALKQEAEQTGRVFRPPVLSNKRWAEEIDGALAVVLLDDETAASVAPIAGDWGGPVSAAVLEKAATGAPPAQAEIFKTAITKMRSRTDAAGE